MKKIHLNPYDERAHDQIEQAIDQWIHNERHREVLKLKLLRGLTYEKVAEAVDMSAKGVQKIVYRSEDKLFRHLKIDR